MLSNRGSGYFPMRIVRDEIKARRLHLVRGAPGFSMPAYVVYPSEHNAQTFGDALAILHRLAARSSGASR